MGGSGGQRTTASCALGGVRNGGPRQKGGAASELVDGRLAQPHARLVPLKSQSHDHLHTGVPVTGDSQVPHQRGPYISTYIALQWPYRRSDKRMATDSAFVQ
jgi:hypothetical protein